MSSQVAGLSVSLWPSTISSPLPTEVPELRRGEGRPQSCNGVGGDQPFGGESAPSSLPQGP